MKVRLTDTISSDYYKGFVWDLEESSFSMDETRADDIPQVFDDENALPSAPHSEKEVKKEFFRCNTIKH
jgi:hypothetical protein